MGNSIKVYDEAQALIQLILICNSFFYRSIGGISTDEHTCIFRNQLFDQRRVHKSIPAIT